MISLWILGWLVASVLSYISIKFYIKFCYKETLAKNPDHVWWKVKNRNSLLVVSILTGPVGFWTILVWTILDFFVYLLGGNGESRSKW